MEQNAYMSYFVIFCIFFLNRGNKKRAFSKISDSAQPYQRQVFSCSKVI